MDSPTFMRRGSEILAALIIAVSTIVFISTNSKYSGTAYRTLSANVTGQESVKTGHDSAETEAGMVSCANEQASEAYVAGVEQNADISAAKVQDKTADTNDTELEKQQIEEILPKPVEPAEKAEPIYRYVMANWLNLRSGPDSGTEKLGILPYGTCVQMLEHTGEWMKIITPDNVEAFVFAEYLSDTKPPVYNYVNVNLLNVRSGPGSEHEKISTLERGSRVQVIEQQGEWAEIIAEENLEGYVYAPYLVANESLVSRAAVVQPYNESVAAAVTEYAKQFAGVPYVYGGSTPKGFDCSGFTKYVYGKYNISLPRSSEEYASVGTKVSRSDLKQGDILLFDRYGSNTLGHVGIYLGKDQFVHASSSKKKVVIMTLSKYNGKFLGARRVIK